MDLEKIRQQKERILLKEKLLKEKEKQKRFKKLGYIEELIIQTNIDALDKNTLLGALIEISQQMNNNEKLTAWDTLAKDFFDKQKIASKTPIVVSFNGNPEKEIKDKIKEMNLRWNGFRKEFYGYGNIDDIHKKLEGTGAKIEACL